MPNADEIEDLGPGDGLKRIRDALSQNPVGPSKQPLVLGLSELHTLESVFQPRDLSVREGEHAAHVSTLAKAIGNPKNPNYLEAITIWWGGDRWYILDGHHRRMAYAKAGVLAMIPVRVFEGTLADAFAHSVSLNSKDKLPMSVRDKTNMAWRLTAYTDLSKSRVALECGIGESTVANMRRAKGQLRALGISAANMLDMSWRDAQAEAKGEQSSEIDRDAAIEKRARGYARSIAKTLKDRPHKDPEGFARALQMLDERLPARLLESEAWEDDLAEYFEAHQRDEADADY